MLFTAPLLSEIYPCLETVSPESQITALHAMGIEASLEKNRILAEIPDNRPDLSCFNGLGRTVAAALRLPFYPLDAQMPESNLGSIYESVDLDVPSEACLRLSAAMAVSCHAGPSPDWIQCRLTACGITPLNILSDIAALVTLETGIPVFLLDKTTLPEGSLIIRDSWPGEEIFLPDGSSFIPETGIPLVCDENFQLLFPAGILNPHVSENCCDVLIVTAVYADTIMKSVRDVLPAPSGNLQRSCLPLDPMMTVPALNRVCHLITALSCGKILDGILDNLNYVPQPICLPVEAALSREVMAALKTFGFTDQEKSLILPSDRKDLVSREDLQKEIQKLQKVLSSTF